MGEFGRLRAESDIDQLFSRVERKPFSSQVIGEQSGVPLEAGGIVDDIYVPPAWEFQFTGGVVNGNFVQGPPDATLPINNVFNKLPGWKVGSEQGSSIEFFHVADTEAPFGSAISVVATDCTSGDRAYLEQVVPVKALDRVIQAWALVSSGDVEANLGGSFGLQELDYTGATVGSEYEAGDIAFNGGDYALQEVQSFIGAAYIRLRLYFEASAATTGESVLNIRQVVLRTPNIMRVTVAYSDIALAADSERAIPAVSTNYRGDPDSAVTFYSPPFPGWVESISVMISEQPAAGSCAYRVRDLISGLIGPTVTINTDSGTFQGEQATADLDHSTNYFEANHPMRLVATGSGLSPTTIDTLAYVTFALIDDRSVGA